MRKLILSIRLFPQNHPKSILIIKSMITLGILTAFGTINYKWKPGSSPYFEEAKEWMESNWFVIPMAIAIPGLMGLFVDLWDNHAKNTILKSRSIVPENILHTVIATIKNIVGAKYDRFGKYIKRNKDKALTFCQVFDEITQPELQMVEITKQLAHCMKALMEDAELKVLLIKVDSKEKRIIAHMPPMEAPPHDLLSRSGTFIDEILEKRQMVVIPNISTEVKKKGKKKKKYAQFDSEGNEGSIVGIPIKNDHTGNGIKYVITIKADNPDMIGTDFGKKFGKVIEHFTHRLKIEDNLLEIKTNAKPCLEHHQ